MNIQEGNLLIAQFMDNWTDTGQEPAFYVYKHKGYESHELLFHESWDWLMLIVEKIESLGYCVEIGFNLCRIKFNEDRSWTDKESKILSVYYRIVKFIKWYNNENTKKKNIKKLKN